MPAHVYRARRTSARVRRIAAATGALVVVAAVAWFATALLVSTPAPRLHLAVRATQTVPGHLLALHPPLPVEEAVALGGRGTIATAGADTPTPIASLTKMMAALVVLRDHPLGIGGSGPEITITPAEVRTYTAERAQQDSVVAVRAGERLSELQALEAALVPSGDNVIQLLATWDAGSSAAFVARMNALARSLGLSHTHYAGPSGVDPASVSTATDQLRLAEVAMANPVFRSIVSMPQVSLPVAGVQYNVDGDLGHDGIDGVKTGWVPQGGGCFVFSARTTVAGSSVSILGAVLDDQGKSPIPDALAQAQRVVVATDKVLTRLRIPSGTPVASLHAPYARPVEVVTGSPVSLLAWQGATVRLRLRAARSLRAAVPAGHDVGSIEIGVGGRDRLVSLRTTTALSGPSLGWRLRHP